MHAERGGVVRLEPFLVLRCHLRGARLAAELAGDDGQFAPSGECVVVPGFHDGVPVSVDPVRLARVADDQVEPVTDAFAGDALGHESGLLSFRALVVIPHAGRVGGVRGHGVCAEGAAHAVRSPIEAL